MYTVIFEGPDLSGKTTIKREFDKRSGYRCITYDRGPITNLVYNKLWSRNRDQDRELWTEIERMGDNVIWVYVEVPTQELIRRLKDRGDELHDEQSLILTAGLYSKMFDNWLPGAFYFDNSDIVKKEISMHQLLKRVEK